MATYKVIQDIEADDKFLGPLSLKQFIFGAGGIFFGWMGFMATIKGAGFLLVVFGPLTLLGLFLAVPWSKDQPTEVWVLAKLRFYFKPKIRVWNQDGIQELVTITVPKKEEKNLTKGFSQAEVTSRLKTLAETLDSRGWSAKRASTGVTMMQQPSNDERLINVASILSAQSTNAQNDLDDPLDDHSGAMASKFGKLINTSQKNLRFRAMNSMQQARGGAVQTQPSRTKNAGATGNMYSMPTKTKLPDAQKAQASSPTTPSADILRLSQNNDLDVKTIEREARRSQSDDKEVVISLR